MGKNKKKSNFSDKSTLQTRGLWRARVVSISDFEFCSPPEKMEINRGDFAVISTRYGKDLAQILGPVSNLDSVGNARVRRIIRIATEKDLSKRRSLEKLEGEAFETCRAKISELGLAMKLVSSHFTFDKQKLLFFFTADNRVDFRELVKLLVVCFKKRIELRQIGARDETRVVGGVGVCGRLFCCHSITDRLAAVSIKTAKDKNLPLGLLKTSGPCSRLLCCMSYELKNHADREKLLPRKGAGAADEGKVYGISEVDMLSDSGD